MTAAHPAPGGLAVQGREPMRCDVCGSVNGSPHFSQGGDGITNFSAGQRSLYAEAISAYGDARLYIGLPMHPMLSGYALRLADAQRPIDDLSDFWRIFYELRASRATGN